MKMKNFLNKKNYPKILLVFFLIIWIWSAISPHYRQAWIAENILTVFLVCLLVITYKKFKFTNLSYTLIFILLTLHTIGSYYSYTEMPLFDLIRDWFELSRNHYDRVIHFLFGVFFFIPVYEFISKKLKIKGFWGLMLAFSFVTALKGIYEVIEYGWLILTRNDIIGTHFLGMQGDQWDAQKDMALGMFGSFITGIILWFKERMK